MKEEQEFNTEDRLIKQLFHQSASLPKDSLKEQIMRSIEMESKPAMVYEPVISSRVWWCLASSFVALLSYLLFFYKGPSNKAYVNLKIPSFDFDQSTQWLEKMNEAFESASLTMPEVHFSALAGISAVIVLGISFIISYQWKSLHMH